MSLITATTWVPRGYAAQFPTKYQFDEEEYERIAKLAKLELDDAKDDLQEAQAGVTGAKPEEKEQEDDEADEKDDDGDVDLQDDDLKEYDLEHYDDDPAEADGNEDEEAEEGVPTSMFGNVKSLAYHSSNAEDPYITLAEGEASDDEDREELQILGTDNLVLAAKIEDEVAHLEVYVYEDSADNLYVHHDIMLPAIPLAVEWLDVAVGNGSESRKDQKANFVAVGTMDPDIELWDLDTIDCMYPNAILGQSGQEASNPLTAAASSKKKKKKSKKANDNFHVDAVLSLAANRQHHNLLCSASADTTIKLWDLNTLSCAKSYSYHTDKVCSLSWHPTQSTVLLSGSYDRTIVAADMRAPDAQKPTWGVESDVEMLRWDPHDDNTFYVSTDSGILHCFDARNAPASPADTKATWRLQAHEASLSSFSVNPAVPGYIATGSTDRSVKLWNVEAASGPSLVTKRDLGVGKVFSVNFAPDDEVAFRLAVSGSKGALQVWDTSTNRAVREAFATRVKSDAVFSAEGKERTIGLPKDDDEDDSDEDEGEGEGGGQDGWESMDE